MIKNPQFLAVKFFRPMTLGARLCRGGNIVDGRFDGFIVCVGENAVELTHPAKFCPRVTLGTGADVALDTPDLGVRRGHGFELLGRAARSEPRGCSLLPAA